MKITKSDIHDRLRDFPKTCELFSRSLLDRPEGRWFRNRLIFLLYRSPETVEALEKMISVVHEKAENFSILTRKLNGVEDDFDWKLLHVYAEIAAARFFISTGYDYVRFLKETSNKATPDLEIGESGVVHFAEVKYVETTADELSPILNRLEEYATENPEMYEKKVFRIEVYPSSLRQLKKIRHKGERDAKIDRLIEKFHREIKAQLGELESIVAGEKKHIVRIKEPFQTKVEIERYPRFMAFFWHPMVAGLKITPGTEFYHYGQLYAKVVGRTHEGFLQLLENRKGDFDLVKQDFLYLHIEEKAYDPLYEDIDSRLSKIFETLDSSNIVQIFTNRPLVMKFDRSICPLFSQAYD